MGLIYSVGWVIPSFQQHGVDEGGGKCIDVNVFKTKIPQNGFIWSKMIVKHLIVRNTSCVFSPVMLLKLLNISEPSLSLLCFHGNCCSLSLFVLYRGTILTQWSLPPWLRSQTPHIFTSLHPPAAFILMLQSVCCKSAP